ncbi:6-bladed beta-propeller [Echinicola soli]|uniref:6-bladed beta-propeller n=1 Tax=Echinicola soli TaxID=2591634 RepID=A0A514CGU8_9BACT|nr:6-bladed beta-propeller [Echinicola soli]QDH79041.1 6-bladed beta-propeller [Echinicola soli]
MKSYTIIWGFALLFCIGGFSCNSSKKPTNDTETISLSEHRSMKMSQIFSEIDYIELPNHFNFFFVDKILYLDGQYFFCDFGHTYKIAILNQDFNLTATIEAYGEGPGEYQYISDACINASKKTIEIISGNKLLRYDLDGDFKEEIKFPFIISKLEHHEGDHYIIHIHPGVKSSFANNDKELSHHLLFQWNSKTNALTPILTNPYDKPLPFITEHHNLKKAGNNYFFTKTFTDTIYWIKDTTVQQKYHLDFKGKMLPLERLQENDMVEFLNNPTTRERYIVHRANIFVNQDYLITSYTEKNNYGTVIYDRKSHLSISASRFENDIDFGLDYFYPRFLQGNIVFNSYPPDLLMEHYNENSDQLAEVDNPFTRLAKNLNRDSGRILALYHLKKRSQN